MTSGTIRIRSRSKLSITLHLLIALTMPAVLFSNMPTIRSVQALSAFKNSKKESTKTTGEVSTIEYIALYDLEYNMQLPIAVDKNDENWKSRVVYIGEGDSLPIEEFCMAIFTYIGATYDERVRSRIRSTIDVELDVLEMKTNVVIGDKLLKDGLLQIGIHNIGNLLSGNGRQVSAPTPPAEKSNIADGTIIQGYAILGLPTLINSYGEKPNETEFIKFVRIRYLPDRPALENNLRPTLGKPVTMELLNDVKKIIMQHYENNHHPVVDISIPEQKVEDGIVQLILTEGVYAAFKIKGNEHYTNDQIKNLFKIEDGKPVDPDKIEKTVRHYNQSPYLKMKTVLEPGTARGDTDIHVNVEDKRPLSLKAGIDNHGNKLTGRERISTAVTYGNFNGPSHLLSYLYISDLDMELLRAHALSYTNFLPWEHTLNINGVVSNAESAFEIPGLDQEGSSFSFGMQYKIPLKKLSDKFNHSVALGTDFKQNNSSLLFNSININNTLTDVMQFALSYEGTLNDSNGYTSFRMSGVTAPGGWTNHSKQDTYTSAGYGNNRYHYLKMDIERSTSLPQSMELFTRFSGQLASTQLPASEQLGVGGHANVRGYDEREANGDVGLFITNEIRTRFFKLDTQYYPVKFTENHHWGSDFDYHWGEISFLAFVDYATIRSHSPGLGTINPNASLLSSGVGFRYRYREYATLNFDYGWQFKDSNASELISDKNNSRGHVYLEAKF